MANPVIFKNLPATFPEEDRYQRPSLLTSIAFHSVLIVAAILVPLLLSPELHPWMTTLLVAPLAPPPMASSPAPVINKANESRPVRVRAAATRPATFAAPVLVPQEILRIIDTPVESIPFVSGVVGGVPGGVANGVLGGILGLNARESEVMLPSTPPPPPTPAPTLLAKEPIRVGGLVQEPKPTRLVPPVYPPLALQTRVTGTVILEATLTVEGIVEEIRVISGHPLLIEAAIDCVKKWKYEPTILNGEPVAVVLTAKIAFYQKNTSDN